MLNVPSKDRFAAWLQRMSPDTIVAQGWDAWTCPVCQFLKSEGWGIPRVMGGDAGLLIGDYSEEPDEMGTTLVGAAPAPDWVRHFVYWADLTMDRRVTAEECLFILDLPYYGKAKVTS